MGVKLVDGHEFHDEIRELLTEYTALLIEGDENFKHYLEKQNYAEEFINLESKYGYPEGRLYLAYYEDEIAGCVGLKKFDGENCEVKRLYVKPQFRGKKIGINLVNQLINDAKNIGYKHILLDTLPFLEGAINMYRKLGFYEIDSYNNSPMEPLVYMKYDLIGE